MPAGAKVRPVNFVGKKGRSGRKKVKEEVVEKAKKKLYKELLDEVMPETLLAKKHRELLTVPRKRKVYVKGELREETTELDGQSVSKALDMAYKLKGEYAPEKEVVIPVTIEAINYIQPEYGNNVKTITEATPSLPSSKDK